MVGGAEKLWWGLAQHLNERTPHQVEIIKLPSPEHDLRSLMRSYEAFSTLELRAFDAVISGKYPAWMVEHPRHICYMLHRLRGLYDAYPAADSLAPEVASDAAVSALRAFMSRSAGARSALAEFFGRWREIAAAGRPEGAFDFPGPLAREMVQWLDAIALAPNAIVRYAAISATVANRPGYFPEGAEVAVAHPPPHRSMMPGERTEHFYTVSRLDGPKRMALVVEAMRKVRTDLPLVLGGTGPEEARIREIAKGDERIRLVGFESDAQVRERYRNALAVPFAPYQEDYGLIAVEAMQCAKPVITTTDSGGPCELVTDGVDGFVCEPTADAIAAAMQRLADDHELARQLGARALDNAARVTWTAVEHALLDGIATPRPRARPAAGARKLVVATTFPVFPPRHGGQSRVFHLYRCLAPEFETVIVSACPADQPAFDEEIAPGLREVRVPISQEHERRERELTVRMGTPVTDVVMPELHTLTPAIAETLRREAQGAAAVVACHPYLYPVLKEIGPPVWYEEQDLEAEIKAALFKDLPGGAELTEAVRRVEGECVRGAQLILCASSEDAAKLADTYGVDSARIADAPNGTDAMRVLFTAPQDRAALKERLRLESDRLAFFMGSGHWPNIEAVQRIFELAQELPGVAFLVMGSVCYAFDPRFKPANVLFMGEVDDVTRNLCLQACDVALNPMQHGSGTNIKMLDYFAAGIPAITTPHGARGLRIEDGVHCTVCDIERFAAAITHVFEDAAAAAGLALAARQLVEEHYDWEAIGKRVKARLLAETGTRGVAA